ncbi:MAG: FHA domain-containing protein [Tychonema bourrellyi B0820]|uniref:FHA domain-containing protein n=2 Tax=Tychonema bourrellyi TaxID=54313 RepID=A0A2G4EUL1_9CYAN|nr:FHA domain-containing protein [Tychonema bourrellyi]MDQ2100264.1 FHA domain-containing protein [Tychonema bourrellyi B0820]PHX53221.1 FHA domain-containing protein [Tychonema bourrellyi FEM_GT703]
MTNQLTLEWTEAGVRQNQTIQNGQPSKNQGTVRIGRDPSKCDIILSHPTVSGLHIEIFFNQESQEFEVRNLRGESNPPLVDGKILVQGEAKLRCGSRLYLGELQLDVVWVSVTEVEIPHKVLVVEEKTLGYSSPTGPSRYGLQCPKCLRISPYAQLSAGCPWCGTSLAAAASVFLSP